MKGDRRRAYWDEPGYKQESALETTEDTIGKQEAGPETYVMKGDRRRAYWDEPEHLRKKAEAAMEPPAASALEESAEQDEEAPYVVKGDRRRAYWDEPGYKTKGA